MDKSQNRHYLKCGVWQNTSTLTQHMYRPQLFRLTGAFRQHAPRFLSYVNSTALVSLIQDWQKASHNMFSLRHGLKSKVYETADDREV